MQSVKIIVGAYNYEAIIRPEDITDRNGDEYVAMLGEDKKYIHIKDLHFRATPCELFRSGWGYLNPFHSSPSKNKGRHHDCQNWEMLEIDGKNHT